MSTEQVEPDRPRPVPGHADVAQPLRSPGDGTWQYTVIRGDGVVVESDDLGLPSFGQEHAEIELTGRRETDPGARLGRRWLGPAPARHVGPWHTVPDRVGVGAPGRR